jgi:hypothetical protein
MSYSEQNELSEALWGFLLKLELENISNLIFASNIFVRKIANTLRKEKYSLILQIPRQKSFV